MTNHTIPDAALSQHIAILGKTGSGKTSTAKLAVEQVVAGGARVCVLDPIKSDWWGLTLNADGKRAGLPFHILGGPYGHVPLHAEAGKAIAEVVANGALPLSIIDMSDFPAPADLAHFFTDFAPTLIRKMRGVLYLVIEEAHEFAPKERAGFGNENMSIHWAKKLATAGRSKGIRLIVATQRVQSLHNAVLGSCETIIAHRLTTPADQKPVNGWLKANVDKDVQEKVAASLSSLPTGTGWLCSGEARIFEQRAFPRIKTYDNSATPTGDGDRRDVRPAPVDQDKLRAIIGTAVAEAEANDPKALKAEIAKLRADLAKKPGAASGVVEKINTADLKAAKDTAFASGRATGLKGGYLRGFDEGWTDGQNATTNAFLASINNFAAIAQGVPNKTKMPKVRVPDDLLSAANQVAPIGTNPRTNYAPIAQSVERRTSIPKVAGATPAGRSNGDTSLSSAQLKVLHALAWWRAMGHDTASRVQVATICRWRSTSSNIRDRSSELKGLGLIEYVGTGETLRLTDAGAAAAPEPDMTADLVTGIRSILSSAQLKVFDALYSNTDPMQRAEIAALVGWSADSSNIRDRCSELVSLEICRYPSPGVVALQDWVRG